MNDVAIVADSSACLPGDLVARYGIRLVPLGLNFGGRIVPDGSLTATELFALAAKSRGRIRTASPPPGDFLAAFNAAKDDGGAASVLCLTLSAAYSGTHDVAVTAAGLAEMPVTVADTGGLAMTHGFAVLGAARALEAGANIEGAAALARRIGGGGRLVGTLDTLRFLVKGGRVPWIVGWAVSLMSIKPVLAFSDGGAHSIARPRTWPAAKARMLSEVLDSRWPARIAVMHSAAPERAAELAEAVTEALHPAELLVTEFSSVMAVHTGPGFVGLAVCHDE